MKHAFQAFALCAAIVAVAFGGAGLAQADSYISSQTCIDGGGTVQQIEHGLGICIGGAYDGVEIQNHP
ncbi:hypothetical protein [Streptomyces sp. NPDC048565]|uniref:hypothetical protein n=1 Tax=Streptomyces sp. NPDC048565 TaxID=3155266 RepID=UPI0034490555